MLKLNVHVLSFLSFFFLFVLLYNYKIGECLLSTGTGFSCILNMVIVHAALCHKSTVLLLWPYFDFSNTSTNPE